jgi:hypothetical protein
MRFAGEVNVFAGGGIFIVMNALTLYVNYFPCKENLLTLKRIW